ncbi:MAG: hypothetical protein RI973_2182 [Bacteroidota bacterium]|jgi:heterodisulfide reductase subunit C
MSIQQIAFIAVLGLSLGLAWQRFGRIRRNIRLGKAEAIGGQSAERWRNVLLVAFGQQKMFSNWIPAVLHLFIYVAFLLTQVELLEIIVDGLTGSHRFFAPMLGGFYTFLISFIEILSLLALVATFAFLARRNLLKVPRFQKPELNGWPRLDGNLILYGEILLIAGIFSMNGADAVLQDLGAAGYPATGGFAISSWLGPLLFGGLETSTLQLIERSGWWLHLMVVLAFLNYLPLSKHLHILLAFPNTYFARLSPRGKMTDIPAIRREVANMINPEAAQPQEEETAGEELVFGASDVFHLSWKNLLDAYSCTECGRCTAACPANLTGKILSPRKIMMDVRDRAEEVGKNLDSGDPAFVAADKRANGLRPNPGNYDDGKSLFDYISPEEIHACTTCNACIEACPVLINPLDIILQLRRHEILTTSSGPADWLPLFNSMENSQAAWSVSTDRDAWRQQS